MTITIGTLILASIISFFLGIFAMGLVAGSGRSNQLADAYHQGLEDGKKLSTTEKEENKNND